MNSKSILFTFHFILFTYLSFSQQINIGILNDKKPQKFLIEVNSGKYKIKSDNKKICRLKKDKSLIVNYIKGTLNLSNERKDFGLYNNLEIVSKKYKFNRAHDRANSKKNSELNVKLITPDLKKRTYQGNITIHAKEKNIVMINQVAMPDYLAGVIEAEGGSKAEFEYYKNQAVICQTYALKNIENHKGDAYNLCDGVHCQAYKGKCTLNPLIQKAVDKTSNLVIVDDKGQLINAVFSANCGGQTNNSEDVWSSSSSYLKSIKDNFCIDQPQASWTKTISFNDFKNFLKDKKIVIADTLAIDSFAFSQPERKTVYTIADQDIKLTTIRFGLNLRSTYFSIKADGQNLIFSGKGYGHGVGMCQEGAMNMAGKGFKFDEIIRYYYHGVAIVHAHTLKK